jgi:hypothetical protein
MEAGAQESSSSGRKRGGHSGRLLLRMPEALHAELAKASQREGVSLNGFITDTLASAVQGSAVQGKAPAARSAAQPAKRTLLERLLLVNLVVVAAVGALVVVLLVQTLR